MNDISKTEVLLASERFPPKEGFKTDFEKLVDRIVAELKKTMAPAGSLGLPPLLEARRLKYVIPNEAFKMQAAYDRILLWQIPIIDDEDAHDSLLVLPDTAKRRDLESAPRGVIVSAGLKALDNIRSNGMDLGHIVNIICQAPFRLEITRIFQKSFYLIILRDGDLIASEDLRKALLKDVCKIEYDKNSNQHLLRDKDGQLWNPSVPWIDDSF